MEKDKKKIRDVLAKYDQKEVEQLLKQARKGSDRAEGIHLPSYVYDKKQEQENKPSGR
jgi:hypothetical protein